MFFFTCGVALTGYSVVTCNGSPIENMEMVVSSVERHGQGIAHSVLQFNITMKVCGLVLSVALLLSSTTEFTRGWRISWHHWIAHDYSWLFFVLPAGVVEISPSGVAPVCRVGDQLELMCTSSGTIHRWEFIFLPENILHTTAPVSSAGTSGVPQPLTVSGSMITFSRLSGQDILPLISRAVVSHVTNGLNGAVVNCFEGVSSTDSVATTTIRIIDPGQLGKTPCTVMERVCWVHHPQLIIMLWCSWLVANLSHACPCTLTLARVPSFVCIYLVLCTNPLYIHLLSLYPHKLVTPLKWSNWKAGPWWYV